MEDLQATPFYKVSFTIRSKQDDTDILDAILPLLSEWIIKKHHELKPFLSASQNPLKSKWRQSTRTAEIEADYLQFDAPYRRFWACKITEMPEAKRHISPRKWITELGLRFTKPDEAVFSCIVSFSDLRGFFGKCEELPKPSIPNIIKKIWENACFECLNGIDVPGTNPKPISSSDWKDFWDRLKSKDRTLPYIYVSMARKGNFKGKLQFEPKKVAEYAGGNAVVYYEADAETANGMNRHCPEDYKCYGGALRVYYPGIDETLPEDAPRHRYLGVDFLDREKPGTVYHIVRRAFAQDTSKTEDFFRIENCRAERSRREFEKQLNEQKERLEQEGLDLADQAETERVQTAQRNANLERENDELKRRNHDLETTCASLQSVAREASELKKSKAAASKIDEYPDSPEKIARYFQLQFADKIVFTTDCMKSLKGCTISAKTLWWVFFHLAEKMRDIFRTGNGYADFPKFRSETKIDVSRGEGKATRKDPKLMSQFKIMYNGEDIDIEPHITYSKPGQSIHFGYSVEEEKIVVGWCGEHLDNYTTQKVH